VSFKSQQLVVVTTHGVIIRSFCWLVVACYKVIH